MNMNTGPSRSRPPPSTASTPSQLPGRRVETERAAVNEFVTTLYAPEDVVYVLAVESWQVSERKTNRVVGRFWFTPESLVDAYEYLREINDVQRANIYVGVNPRTHPNSPRVDQVRCVWADIDREAPDATLARLPPVLPKPSMVVSSGTGTHLYWMLSESVEVKSQTGRTNFEGMLKRFYAAIGGDWVQDVDRLLRLPGLVNQKNARNGKAPIPCTLEHRNSSSHPLSVFAPWWPSDEQTRISQREPFHSLDAPRTDRTLRRIAGLVRHLDTDTRDRSSRDFSVVCGLLRLGVSSQEIAELVSGHSKFSDNPKYVARTIQNALVAIKRSS